MNSKERVLARIHNQPVDRIPNLNILMFLAAKEIGVSYAEYCQDYRKLAHGNIVSMQKYGIDAVSTISDPMRESADLGMEMEYPEDGVPRRAKEYLIKEKSDLLKVKPVPVEKGRRMTDRVLGTELLKKEVGNDFPVIGWVEGAFAQAADIRGISEFLMDIYDDPPFVVELLELCLEQEILFAKAQIDAGADIIGVGDAIASVAGPFAYKDLALQYEVRLLKAIKDAGALSKLHICGNITPFLELLPVQYCDIIDIDWMVSLEKAGELYGDVACVNGNYDPVAVLLQGNVQGIKDAVKQCVQVGGAKYTSSAGCEVPKYTPPENLMAVYDALQELAVNNIK
ncbi:MAG: uroporphyrinogen decarboxylase family protein [Tannerella sp.]|jgi:uroporphyrinogen decarboxylase|nr:uroporphyrinogen decarboxylase family protein [Tannerella sp.]